MGISDDETTLNMARLVFDDMKSGKFECSHDAYLKLYQLSKPTLDYEFIYLDECQDVTPAILQIVLRQKANKILVGDIHQQIYQFRNVCNPFTIVDHYTYKTLSVSFRYGYSITRVCNMFLKTFKKETKCIESNSPDDTVLLAHPTRSTDVLAYICRTNYNALSKAFEYDDSLWILGCDYNCEKEAAYIRSIHKLSHGEVDISKFENHTLHTFTIQCIMYSVSKWILRLKIYQVYGVEAANMWLQLRRKLNKDNHRLLISTVHKSKGLEFDNVCMSNDFCNLVSRIV
jgi:hypothetical protein